MVLTVSFVLSPAIGLSCHRHPRFGANLTPASRRQDHTTSPSASRAVRQTALSASTASRSALMTLANAPLWLEMARLSAIDLPDGASEIFFAQGMDEFLPDGQIT
jgi:hypothetical protein